MSNIQTALCRGLDAVQEVLRNSPDISVDELDEAIFMAPYKTDYSDRRELVSIVQAIFNHVIRRGERISTSCLEQTLSQIAGPQLNAQILIPVILKHDKDRLISNEIIGRAICHLMYTPDFDGANIRNIGPQNDVEEDPQEHRRLEQALAQSLFESQDLRRLVEHVQSLLDHTGGALPTFWLEQAKQRSVLPVFQGLELLPCFLRYERFR